MSGLKGSFHTFMHHIYIISNAPSKSSARSLLWTYLGDRPFVSAIFMFSCMAALRKAKLKMSQTLKTNSYAKSELRGGSNHAKHHRPKALQVVEKSRTPTPQRPPRSPVG